MKPTKNSDKIAYMLKAVRGYKDSIIEQAVVNYVSIKTGVKIEHRNSICLSSEINDLVAKLSHCDFPYEIENIICFFEALLSNSNVIENGIVFTPRYIADYINDVENERGGLKKDSAIIDPGCGCGIFLVSTTLYLRRKYHTSYEYIYENNIYGIDIDKDNIRRCEIVLRLLPMYEALPYYEGRVNIIKEDSLKIDWKEKFNVQGFDLVEGNPPYVNLHDMKKETAYFLKENFVTTQTGVYNIFYAFIEHGMKFLRSGGTLSFIVPNNFLTILAARDLRNFINRNKFLDEIVDFANNMVFKPVRTYSCIIRLSNTENSYVRFAVIQDTNDIKKALQEICFSEIRRENLNEDGWKLVDSTTYANIKKIENQLYSLKPLIRTGIATLKDEVYFVNYDGFSYYKEIDGKRFDIDADLVKEIYKIPELKHAVEIRDAKRYIIFPYRREGPTFEVVPQDEMRMHYLSTYKYFKAVKHILGMRDKGKVRVDPWYAYGRTQGLNKYGRKLLFPTFANTPRFVLVNAEDALFCNGYAVFEDDYTELEVLLKILNSFVMRYYISNTSYAIEGGYFCYQKKYIEKFTFPYLSESEKRELLSFSDNEVDMFLIKKYQLDL